MTKTYELWPFNFGAVHKQDFQKAKVVIFPIPYEGTVSFSSGTNAGPYSIIENSRYLDEMLDAAEKDKLVGLASTDVFTLDEIVVSKDSPAKALDGVQQVITDKAVREGKFPITLGGEHSITYGAVKAVKQKIKDISVLHFDAHTDFLNSFEGTKWSHACVMRRIRELNVPTVSIGIRNINAESEQYIRKHRIRTVYYAPNIPPLKTVLKGLTRNVYITFDFDCFDPSIMPSVGTPEPGGLGWYEVLNFVEKVFRSVNIVGADAVELKPIPGLEAPNFLAAKLVYNFMKLAVDNSRPAG